ncbi:MAG: primosomal protein N' [Alphaproteobacteria bacterium]|nr:primosomal protein N' [Alphaproteobacteria bacterium]
MKSIKSKEVAVLLIGPFNDTFDYLIEENINEISPGQIVLAPFRQRKVVGIIVSEGSKTVSKSKLKTVIDIYELDPIPLPTIDLISFLANWNCVYKGLVLKMVLSPLEAIISPQYNKVYKYNLEDGLSIDSIDNKKLRSKRKLVLDALVNSDKEVYETSLIQDIGVSKTILKDMVNKNLIVEKLIKIKPDFSKNFIKSNDIKKENDKPLNEHQKNAVDKINKSIKKNEADCFLLDGVPGSGKTETYFETVQTCLDERKQVLILLPEIALTPDWQKRFYNKFNFNPLVWHSDISKKKRKEIWLSALSGTAGVIVGARSALMIPISKLGLIVVDEEHEPAFKQEENVRYNARDMAVYRAKRSSATIVLASATPSLETFYNMRMGKYIHLTLPKRATGADMPDIKLLDLKLHPPQKGNWISPLLINQIQDKLLKKEQTLLFLNRRGYAPLRVCNSCGNKVKCINCETWLVEHRLDNLLTCHHCGYSKHISNICEVCGNKDQMKSCGPGVERIEEEVQRLFPEAKSITLSSDTMKNQNLLTNAIEQIKNSEVDIIIGTQMVAKGHDFPKLKLVGIIDGDIGLSGGDLRASERSFQLLQQVAGRSGRHTAGTNDKGIVYLQTFDTENPIIKAIAQNNRDDFFEKELISRKNANMPPYGRLAAIILSSKFESNLDSFASDISRLAPSFKNVKIFGPAPAPMYFLRGKYRRRFLIKSDKTVNIQKVLIDWTKKINKPSSINLTIDIDPFSFM